MVILNNIHKAHVGLNDTICKLGLQMETSPVEVRSLMSWQAHS